MITNTIFGKMCKTVTNATHMLSITLPNIGKQFIRICMETSFHQTFSSLDLSRVLIHISSISIVLSVIVVILVFLILKTVIYLLQLSRVFFFWFRNVLLWEIRL